MSEIDEPLTLATLQQRRPKFIDVPIEGLGTFRLHRPKSLSVMLEFAKTIGEISDEAGDVELDDMVQHLSGFVAMMLGGDFETEEGIEELKALGVGLTPLIRAASELAGTNIGESTHEAKND